MSFDSGMTVSLESGMTSSFKSGMSVVGLIEVVTAWRCSVEVRS